MTALPKPAVQGPGAQQQSKLPLTDERRAMLAKIHIGRKQLKLDEDVYRGVVKHCTGSDSCSAASDAGLHRLLAELRRLGFKPKPAGSVHSNKPNVRLIAALWTELQPFLTDGSPEALRAFVQRQTKTKAHPEGVSAPEFLDAVQANRVIEGLKAWLKRTKKGESHDA